MTAWFGYLACALLPAAIAASWPAPPRNRRINATLVALAALLPLPGGDSAAQWLHALLGTPSMPLAGLALLTVLGQPPRSLEKPVLLAFVLLAVEFYALALGLGQFDVYGIGYRGPLLVAALFPIGMWLWYSDKTIWLTLLAAALFTYAGGLYANLWDALFDPLLVGMALVRLAWPGRQPILGRQ